jgi:hypothetical protein
MHSRAITTGSLARSNLTSTWKLEKAYIHGLASQLYILWIGVMKLASLFRSSSNSQLGTYSTLYDSTPSTELEC